MECGIGRQELRVVLTCGRCSSEEGGGGGDDEREEGMFVQCLLRLRKVTRELIALLERGQLVDWSFYVPARC